MNSNTILRFEFHLKIQTLLKEETRKLGVPFEKYNFTE